jgi:hypothetical protein
MTPLLEKLKRRKNASSLLASRKRLTDIALSEIRAMLRKGGFATRIVRLSRDDTSLNRLYIFLQLDNNLFNDVFLDLMERLPPLLSLYSIDITQDYGCTYNGNASFADQLSQLGYHISNKNRGENPSFPTCSQFYKRHPRRAHSKIALDRDA